MSHSPAMIDQLQPTSARSENRRLQGRLQERLQGARITGYLSVIAIFFPQPATP